MAAAMIAATLPASESHDDDCAAIDPMANQGEG
jgi:hypothetical protein